MGYFSNATEWEIWAQNNCFKCAHWPTRDNDKGCPVELIHNLYNYNQSDQTVEILDILIPKKKGHGNSKCAMFIRKSNSREKEAVNWEKYKAAMKEMESKD